MCRPKMGIEYVQLCRCQHILLAITWRLLLTIPVREISQLARSDAPVAVRDDGNPAIGPTTN